MNARYPSEKASIKDEREMIKTIMRYIGILDDQPLDAATSAAGVCVCVCVLVCTCVSVCACVRVVRIGFSFILTYVYT
jgi:hypothetical protein